jgi:hypothetical protein
MVAVAIDAAMADNAAAVNRLDPLIIFFKAVARRPLFLSSRLGWVAAAKYMKR